MNKLLVSLLTFGLAVASAASSYKVTLHQSTVVNGTELKAGDYKVDVQDNKAVIRSGKSMVEAQVKLETADTKFGATTVRYTTEGGKYRVQEIRLGGTNTKLVFEN